MEIRGRVLLTAIVQQLHRLGSTRGILFLVLIFWPTVGYAVTIWDPPCGTFLGLADANKTVKISGDIVCPGLWLSISGTHDVTVNLNGYSVSGPGPLHAGLGIVIDGATNVTVRGGALKNFELGIFLHANSDNGTIIGVCLEGNSIGILILDSKFVRVEHDTIQGPGTVGVSLGLDFGTSVSARIMENTISGQITGIRVGVGSQAFISKNTVTGNTTGLSVGGSGPADVTVICNDFSNNMQDGIDVTAGNAQIDGNTVNGNGGHGIFIASPLASSPLLSARVEDNTASSNGLDGIRVQMVPTAQNFIVNNEAFSNGAADLSWDLSGGALNCFKLNRFLTSSPASFSCSTFVNIH